MEIVENWSKIVGTVDEWSPPAEANGPGTIVVRVQDVGSVVRGGETYPNLLESSKGETVRVQVPDVDAHDLHLAPGSSIELEVRRGRSAAKIFSRPGTIRILR